MCFTASPATPHLRRSLWSLQLSSPPETTEDGYHFSRVSLPTLFPDEKRLFGVDGDQAKEIAEMVARDVLKGFGISITAETDVSGN